MKIFLRAVAGVSVPAVISVTVISIAGLSAHAQTLYNAKPSIGAPAQMLPTTQAPLTVQPSTVQPSTAQPLATQAQRPNVAVSGDALSFARAAGQTCPGDWGSAACMRILSQSNFMMLSNYGALLQSHNMKDDAEQLKQHCAASTAAREQSFPAYAMKSAFIECANKISDIVEKTGLKPDMSEYQLMGAAVLCLNDDPRCASITAQIKELGGQ